MSAFRKWIPSRRWLILPPVALGIAVVGFLASSRKELVRVPPQEVATQLKVVRVERQNIPAEAIGYGTAQPRRVWSAVAEIGGKIVQTHPNLRSGIAVRAGELLLKIDPSDYRFRVQQREAELVQAEAQWRQLKLNQTSDEKSLEIQEQLLQVRESDLNRLVTLNAQKAASAGELDASRANFLQQSQTVQTLKNALTTYSAQIAAAQATIDSAKAKLAEAKRELDRTEIAAPFDGLLSDVDLETDQYIAPGQTLFRVVDAYWVEIEAQFSMSQLGRVIQTLPHPASTDADSPSAERIESEPRSATSQLDPPDKSRLDITEIVKRMSAMVTARSGSMEMSFTGQPIRFTDSLNEQTRTLGVVVRVNNSRPANGAQVVALRPGSFCEVKLLSSETSPAFLVPRTSVEGGTLFVVDREGRLARKTVVVGHSHRDNFTIKGGLNEGDLVVMNPPAVVMEGQQIDPLIHVYLGDRISAEKIPPDTDTPPSLSESRPMRSDNSAQSEATR